MFKSFEELLQPRLTGSGLVVLSDDSNYVIPRCETLAPPRLVQKLQKLKTFSSTAFAREWLSWSRKPANNERPSAVDNEQFMCTHGRVVIDLDREAERPKDLCVVTEKQWNALVRS